MPTTDHIASAAVGETFFDRTEELGVIERWMDLAADGDARIGVVEGPPGVGKSRLQQVVGDRAAHRGFRVLFGRAYEETPPLFPILTALGPLIEHARQGRRTDLSDADLAELDLLAGGTPRADGGSRPDARHDTRTYLVATKLLLGAARSRPVLLAVDDAHALDDASAALLAHLAAAAAHRSGGLPVRLLTLVTVRTGAGRPLALRTIGRLRDERGGAALGLRGLDEVDLNDLLASLGPAPPSRPLLRAIRQRTAGNPLFARLLWTHLVESDAAVERQGRMWLRAADAAEMARLSLDEIVDERASALGEPCRELLAVASLLGTEGAITVLAAAVDQSREEVEDLLYEADAAGVCHVDGERYRFDHPLLVPALARRFSPRQRRRLHADLAAAMTRISPPPVLDIAANLRAAGSLATEDDRRRWGVAAAMRAAEVGAWGDAVAAYSLALDDGLDEGLPVEERIRLYVQASHAAAADHDLESCERFSLAAVRLARELDDLDSWCAAISELGHARVRVAPGGVAEPVAELGEFIEAAGERQPRLRARALGLMAEVSFAAFDFDAGLAYAQKARALAEEAGDDDVLAFVLFALGLQHQGRLELDDSDRCFADSVRHGDATRSFVSGWARARLPSTRWLRGELMDAGRAADLAEPLAEERMDWAELSLLSAWRANVAGAMGRFAAAEDLAERALALHRRSDYEFTQIVANPPLAIARAMRGNVEGAHRGLDEWRQVRATRWIDQLDTLVDALAGDVDAVRRSLGARHWRVIGDEAVDLRRAAALFAQVEVGAVAGDVELVAAPRRALESLHERGVRFVPGSLSLLSRLCALSAAADGDGRAATEWLDAARRDARGAGAAAELARCDLDEARLLQDAGGSAETVDRLLSTAARSFDRLGMLPLLRRAETLLGTSADGAVRARKVILFTDLVGSTSLNVSSGDEAYVQLLRAHDRIVREGLRRYGGVEFKHTGDGVAAWFASPRQAVRCALELQDTLAGALHAESGVMVSVRCGLAAGDPVEEGGDLFGLAVARASRICALADGGTVLVSDEIAAMSPPDAFAFEDRGAVALRGIPGESRVLVAHGAGG